MMRLVSAIAAMLFTVPSFAGEVPVQAAASVVNPPVPAPLSPSQNDASVMSPAMAAALRSVEIGLLGSNPANFGTPVRLSIPVGDTSSTDSELLTLAKIVDGKLEAFGGRYSRTKLVNEARDSF